MNRGNDDANKMKIAQGLISRRFHQQALDVLESMDRSGSRNPAWKLPWVGRRAECLHALGRFEEEEILLTECLALCGQMIDDQRRDNSQIGTLHRYSTCLLAQNKFEEAALICERSFQMSIELFGPNHAGTFIRLRNYVHSLYGAGHNEDADSWYEALILTGKRLWGHMPQHSVITVLQKLAEYFAEQDAFEQATPFFQEALSLMIEAVRCTAAKLRAEPACRQAADDLLNRILDLASYADRLNLFEQKRGLDRMVQLMRARFFD